MGHIDDELVGLKIFNDLGGILYAEHDVIMIDKVGPYTQFNRELIKANWFWSEEYDCWTHFV